jgi:hypothetical protein
MDQALIQKAENAQAASKELVKFTTEQKKPGITIYCRGTRQQAKRNSTEE